MIPSTRPGASADHTERGDEQEGRPQRERREGVGLCCCLCGDGKAREDNVQNTVLAFMNHVADSVHEDEQARRRKGFPGNDEPSRWIRRYSRAYLDKVATDAGVFDPDLLPGDVDGGWNPAWNRKVSEQQWRRAVCLFLQAYLLSTGSLEPHVVAKIETCKEPAQQETSMHVYFSACVVPEVLDCPLVGTWKDLAEDFFEPLHRRRDGSEQLAPWHLPRFEDELRCLFQDVRCWSDLLESTEAFMMDNDLLDHTMMNLHLLVLFEVRNMMITQTMRLQVEVSTGAADMMDSYTATVERTDYRFMGGGQRGTPAASGAPPLVHGAAQDRSSLLRLQQEMDLFWIGQSMPGSAGYEQAAFSPPPFPGMFVHPEGPLSEPTGAQMMFPSLGADGDAPVPARYLLEAFCLPAHGDFPAHEGSSVPWQPHEPSQRQQRARPTGQAGGGALGIFTYTCSSPWIEFSSLLAHMSAAMLRGCMDSRADSPQRHLRWSGMQLHTTCVLRLENDSGASMEVFRGVCVTERKLEWEASCAEKRLRALMLSYKGKMAYLRNIHDVFKNPDLVHHIALQACGKGVGPGVLPGSKRRLFPNAVRNM